MYKYVEIKSGKDTVEAYYNNIGDVGEYVDWLLDNNYKIKNKKLSTMPLHISVAIELMRNNTLDSLTFEEDEASGDIIENMKDKGYRFMINKRYPENKYQYIVFFYGDIPEEEIEKTKGQKYHYMLIGDVVDKLKDCVRNMVADVNSDFIKHNYMSDTDVQIITKDGLIIDRKFRGDQLELKTYIETIMREGFMMQLDKDSKIYHSPSTIKTVEIKTNNYEDKRKIS